ncbi:Proto-oncogene tyrosine-protein kinase ROS [Camponotus floridanus]|uniref:receptor protein-tyrosine kinase n=1 Tax=Camponotus floridanus TaxID=104421 RepID=E2A7V8_CAMFO|nr:Proto-oncogene tyrosine-protein kinase ROS [Camponotus floridanus]
MFEKSDHHILNFKSDWTARNEGEVDEVTLANISIIPDSIESSLNKPTSLRAFVQFDSQFTKKVNDIFVTLRWNQSEFTDLQGYTVQCFFIEDLKKIQICDDKNITTLEHTVHNLKPNTTYYFRVRAHTESSLNKPTSLRAFVQFDSQFTKKVNDIFVTLRWNQSEFTDLQGYTVQCFFIEDLKKIQICDDKNITTLEHTVHNLKPNTTYYFRVRAHTGKLLLVYIKNLYIVYIDTNHYSCIVKFDLTMWENGITKFDEISKARTSDYLILSSSMGILYRISYNWMNKEYGMIKYHFDGKNEQIFQISLSLCQFRPATYMNHMIIDNMNNEKPLIYWIETFLPTSWMAPESSMIKIFTSQSDVWSFGVLMWEIISLGEQSYITKTNEEVINYVRAGGRLPMTLNCPSPLYQLMLRCWTTADAR